MFSLATISRKSSGAMRIGLALASAWLSACGSDATGPPPRPSQLGVTVPQGDVAAGLPVSVTVTLLDRSGNRVPGSTAVVTLTLATNNQGATLSGMLSAGAVDGVATFTGVRISRAGRAFTLIATAASLTGMSSAFDVRLRLGSVSVGSGMACGLAPSGDAYCWGRNQSGGLGNGTSGSDRARPVLVAGNLSFVQLDAGSGSNANGIFDGGACGLTATAAAYCWGRNDYGQLGNGNGGVDSKVPAPVSGQIEFLSVGMGLHHACGLARSGEIYCWGNNGSGALGNDSLGVERDVPVRVAGGLMYTALFVGDMSNCGRATAGDLYCWGFAAPTDQDGVPVSTAPTLLAGVIVFSQAHPGTFLHMCGVGPTAEGYCWGQDYLAGGALGSGTPGQNEPAPTLVTGGHHWASIGAGGSSSCGLRTDSVAMCWGYDYNGEVGQGTLGTGATTPALVIGGLKFTQLDVGHGSSCAVTPTGDAYCWGSGLWGERGDGTFTRSASPVRVVTP